MRTKRLPTPIRDFTPTLPPIPQALSRAQLIQNVWGDDYFGDENVVDVYVRYLRKKLEGIRDERIIQTVRGIGFALRLDDQ